MKSTKKSIGKILLEAGKIKEAELKKALEEQATAGQKLGEILVRLGLVDEETILAALSSQIDIPFVDISEIEIPQEIISLIPVKFAYSHKILPLKKENNTLTLAMVNPFDLSTREDVRFITSCNVRVVLSTEQKILQAIKKYYGVGAETVEKMLEEKRAELPAVISPYIQTKKQTQEDASIIKFVNQIISEAYQNNATDIHIEPFEKNLRIRYRIDGVLAETNVPEAVSEFTSSIVSRIKIMADMNIAEKRFPQDGRIKIDIDSKQIDLRVSTIPTIYGESIDLRILPRENVLVGLETLGISAKNQEEIENLIKLPYGMLLITGPTGHGKTTTLYSCLSKINSVEKKIITIEDPVEYRLKGINQLQIHPKIGLTFATGLRSILRQDPDVIMIGEIRDTETAEIAIRSSHTGHLVFSTLHTNTATGAVTRLLDMGIEPYLVASSINAILSERLIRLLCNNCKEHHSLPSEYLKKINLTGGEIFRPGMGCKNCRGTGYAGRTGIFELFLINDEIRKLVLQKTTETVIRNTAVSSGMIPLKEEGFRKVAEGLTSVEEVLRVI